MADGRGVSNKAKQIEMDNDRGIETKRERKKRREDMKTLKTK